MASAGTATHPDQTQGTGFAIDHYTIDNGGGTSSGGAFSISGTIGQPDADRLQPSTGSVFAITGGSHVSLADRLPVAERARRLLARVR